MKGTRHCLKQGSYLPLLVVGLMSSSITYGQPQVPPYEIVEQEDVMVPMRDGVKLATDIYLPAKQGAVVPGEFPVILTRTPYGKHETAHGRDQNGYVPYGYVLVKQDTRGRGNSEGVWHWMTDDRKDGYDAIEWIAKQPWCNGKIGMVGCSYHGATQHLAAMERAPHLTTIVPNDPSVNHGIGAIRYGGAFRLRVFNWIYSNAARGSRQSRDPALREALERQAKDRLHYLVNLPLRRGLTPLRLAPEYEDILIDMLEHGANDAFWRFSNIIEYVDEHKDIPTFMIGGWYDLFSSSTTETYAALRKTKKGPVYLLMGPWTHGATGRSNGQVDFGEDAVVSAVNIRRAWYDRWLRGLEEGFGKEIPFRTNVRIFVMGTGDGRKTKDGKLYHGGYWREAADYPLPEARFTKFYMHEGGELSAGTPVKRNSATVFEFDPKNPVPTVGGCTCCAPELFTSGAYNQWGGEHTWSWPVPIPLSARNDVVVFQTEPLEQDTEIIGPIQVKLWASSSAIDTDFTAKLLDVYPAREDFPVGFDLIMGDGIIRARFRENDKEERLMTPGQVYEFNIKLDPCSNVFKKGHRIRVDVSSSNYPRFDVNPNSGERLDANRRMITAVNTIYHDSRYPSHIILPIMPAQR